VKVHIYVEGGGDTTFHKRACAQGFRKLLKKIILPDGPMPEIIACGSRQLTYKRFCTAIGQSCDKVCLLLVDSEAPVTTATVWEHLKNRRGDGWECPSATTEENVYLMVQCMESWFLADHDVLKQFYGQGFNANVLPKQPNIERISKQEVYEALKAATRTTKTKGEYHKTKHSFTILALLDPKKVGRTSRYANRLFKFLNKEFLC
jgi:hypothetical protein